jgi:hypothetical protein
MLTLEEDAEAEEAFAWFAANLPIPARLARSRKPGAQNNALSWYRPTAREHIRRTRGLSPILHAHGFLTRMITTNRVGRVVYEDKYQVVGVPYRDTRVV